MKFGRAIVVGLGAVIPLAAFLFAFRGLITPLFFRPPPTEVESGRRLDNLGNNKNSIETIAEDLEIPWELVFLPEGDLLVTERPGRLRRLGETERIYRIEDVHHIGEGGLLGMALHPDFEDNRRLYLYLTFRRDGRVLNRVDRFVYTAAGELESRETILDDIPGARFHNGGRIRFGPDGFLYITTGDALEVSLSQDPGSLAGKILRVQDDGAIPAGNPFGNAVYSSGHRNPQGLAWDGEGRLWATEHGARGNDEINLIEKGLNYGWPEIEGDDTAAGMEAPVKHSGADTWAPGGAAFAGGSLFFAGLRGQSLYQAKIDPETVGIEDFTAHFRLEYGRLRNVVSGPDGYLYLMTSNRDGRGRPAPEDDRIIRIFPGVFDNN